jgi:hypothetical protein
MSDESERFNEIGGKRTTRRWSIRAAHLFRDAIETTEDNVGVHSIPIALDAHPCLSPGADLDVSHGGSATSGLADGRRRHVLRRQTPGPSPPSSGMNVSLTADSVAHR